jgi:hypothetical protein
LPPVEIVIDRWGRPVRKRDEDTDQVVTDA